MADGALKPVLSMCAMKEAVALLALMTLSHIVEFQGNLAPLIEVKTAHRLLIDVVGLGKRESPAHSPLSRYSWCSAKV